MKTLREEINNYLAAIPEKEIATGIYVTKVGYKYVTIINSWETTSSTKESLVSFYNEYVAQI